MATYYRWNRNSMSYTEEEFSLGEEVTISPYEDGHVMYSSQTISNSDFTINLNNPILSEELTRGLPHNVSGVYCMLDKRSGITAYKHKSSFSTFYVESGYNGVGWVLRAHDGDVYQVSMKRNVDFIDYVYSTSPSAYPNGGVQGDYYYDQRTTITSPTAPTGLTYPTPITAPTINVSWPASVSNVPSYSVSTYEVSYATNGGSNWKVAGTTTETNLDVTIPVGITSIQFRVRAKDSNGQWSDYFTGTTSNVLLAPKLTVPSIAMQGQPISLNWTAVTGATSYTLQRKANTDDGWVQVYSGDALTFTETVGAWTSVKYQVQAVFPSGTGGWATSASIPVVSASALVISGQDGDLGTLTADVPYTVSSDTGNDITLARTVNGVQVASLTVESGFAYSIPVMDLPTGTGTIVITATVETSSDPVTVTRTWTYTKTPFSFPDTGGTAQLQQEGKNVFPATLAECVRAGKLWGGSLDKALEMLGNAVTYTATSKPKYSEVTVNLAEAQVGDIVNLPYNGAMVPHIVVHIGNPDAEMYDSSCDGVWLMRQDCSAKGQWNSTNVNTLDASTIITTMQEYVANYDTTVSSQIKTVKIPYCVGGGNSTVNKLEDGLECQVFPLSSIELGWTQVGTQFFPTDGAKLDYFQLGQSQQAVDLRRAKFENEYVSWYTRSPDVNNETHDNFIISVAGNGNFTVSGVFPNYAYRTSFILPHTFSATYFVDPSGTIHAEQEYTVAGDFSDLLGNTIPVPKIEMGSYVGTGTYGVNNPNTLTFSFEPKILVVSGQINDSEWAIGLFFKGSNYYASLITSTSNGNIFFRTQNVAVFSGKTVSWYLNMSLSQGDQYQFNSPYTFSYGALG